MITDEYLPLGKALLFSLEFFIEENFLTILP